MIKNQIAEHLSNQSHNSQNLIDDAMAQLNQKRYGSYNQNFNSPSGIQINATKLPMSAGARSAGGGSIASIHSFIDS